MVDPDRERVEHRFREFADPGASYDGRVLVLGRWNGAPLDPPVFVHLAAEELLERITVSEETRDALWPGRSVEEAGIFLFATHLGNLLTGPGYPRLNHVVKDADGSLVLASNPEGEGAAARFTPPAAQGGRGLHLYTPLTDQRYPDDESRS